MAHRISCSIALFRKPDEKCNQWQILLGKRRVTMFFSAFYSRITHIMDKISNEELVSTINKMSLTEKNILINNNFDNIWGYLNFTNFHKRVLNDMQDYKSLGTELFKKQEDRRFYNIIKSGHKKITSSKNILHKLNLAILDSKEHVEPEWSIPRGKLEDKEEYLDCAIREFKEETGITPDKYDIITTDATMFLHNAKYLDKNYQTIYFIAIENTRSVPKVLCPHEIVDLKFIPVSIISNMGVFDHLLTIIPKMYSYIRKYKNDKKKQYKIKKIKSPTPESATTSDYF
jgi:8-oxo-dGTP pyrophosphatase MutT (NUDIX family)